MSGTAIGDKGGLERVDGFLRLKWKEGSTIEVQDAEDARAAVDALGQGEELGLLISIQGVTFSRPARKVLPSPSSVSRIALVGSSPVDRVIALFLLQVSPLPCPVKYFTSDRKATAWLGSSRAPAAGKKATRRRPAPRR
jgi:hypothetical protein